MNARSVRVDIAAVMRQRALRGWSQQHLAEKAHVSAQTLSNLNRDGRCSPAVLRKIARAFSAANPEPGVDALLADEAAA